MCVVCVSLRLSACASRIDKSARVVFPVKQPAVRHTTPLDRHRARAVRLMPNKSPKPFVIRNSRFHSVGQAKIVNRESTRVPKRKRKEKKTHLDPEARRRSSVKSRVVSGAWTWAKSVKSWLLRRYHYWHGRYSRIMKHESRNREFTVRVARSAGLAEQSTDWGLSSSSIHDSRFVNASSPPLVDISHNLHVTQHANSDADHRGWSETFCSVLYSSRTWHLDVHTILSFLSSLFGFLATSSCSSVLPAIVPPLRRGSLYGRVVAYSTEEVEVAKRSSSVSWYHIDLQRFVYRQHPARCCCSQRHRLEAYVVER